MSIYTKKGDDGKTSIFKKKEGKTVRVSKASLLVEVIGSVDEVNSYLGIITSKLKTQKLKLKNSIQNSKIEEIQRNLFEIGSVLAGADILLKDLKVEKLEKEIDRIENKLPKLTGFILPGGLEISAQIMFARTLVRRIERKIVWLIDRSGNKSNNNKFREIIPYMNRLSDYLFVLARWINYKNRVKEIKWRI